MRAASAIQADCFAGNRLGPARAASEEQNGVAAPLRPRGNPRDFRMPCSPDAPRGPEGQGDGGIRPRGRAREALRESFPRHCENRFPSFSPTLQKPLSFTLRKSFPLSRDARGKTVNEKPARGLPHDNRPRRVGCAFCAETIANEQKRSQMSMALCAKCAGKPRKAPESRKKPPEIAGAGAETGENAQE